MFICTHLTVAENLAKYLKPQQRQEYYLGAVIPDIRYCDPAITREQTHLSVSKLAAFGRKYPYLRSFVLGFTVHCMLDEQEGELIDEFLRRFPLSLVRNRLRRRFPTVLAEMYSFEAVHTGNSVGEISNVMLDELDVRPASVVQFSRLVNGFLKRPSLETGIQMAQDLGLFGGSRVAQYLDTIRFLQRHSALKRLLFLVTRMPLFSKRMASVVRESMRSSPELQFH
jgi:hypothetical protein